MNFQHFLRPFRDLLIIKIPLGRAAHPFTLAPPSAGLSNVGKWPQAALKTGRFQAGCRSAIGESGRSAAGRRNAAPIRLVPAQKPPFG